jgi:DNA repair protein RadA/Sms
MLLAVLGKLGFALHDRDVFVNAAGGVRLDEPATDLAAVAAIASSLRDRPVADDVVLLGEVGLVGEVRAVAHPRERLREAGRHGFRRVIAPHACADDPPAGVQVVGVRTVAEALDAAFE